MKKRFLSLIMFCVFCIGLLPAAGAAAEAEAVTTVIVPAAEEKTAQVYYAGAEKAEAEEKTGEEAGVTFHPYVFEVDGNSQVKASVQLEPGLMKTSPEQTGAKEVSENTTVSYAKPELKTAKIFVNATGAFVTVSFIAGNTGAADYETYAYTTDSSLAMDSSAESIEGTIYYLRSIITTPAYGQNVQVTNTSEGMFVTFTDQLYSGSLADPQDGEILYVCVEEVPGGKSNLKKVTVGGGSGGENATTQISLDPQKTVITLDPEKPVFNWEQIKPEETVMYDGVTLVKDTDYTVVYGDNINAGENAGSVTVIGTGSYCDNITKTFDILPQEMTADNTVVTLENNTYTHTGSEIEPKVVSVVCDGKMLKENVDYVVLYKNNIDVGTGKVWVKGEGNFGGTVEKPFTIEQAGLSHDELMAYIPSNLTIRTSGYNETVVKVDVSWKEQKDVTMYDLESSVLINETKVPLKNDVSSIALEGEGIPAHVAYQVSNGTSTFKNYKLFVLKEDEAQTDSSGQIAYGVRDGDTVIFTLAAYIGSQMSPNAVVQYKVQLNVTGTVLDPAYTQVILNPQNATYTGEQITTGVTVICNDITLVQDTDYTVLWGENVNVGDGTVTVFGKGNYTGNITAAFGINPAPANSLEIKLEKTKYTYTGKAIKPKTTVKLGKTVLEEGRDYTVSYANNKKVGTARVKITGKGNFTGEAEKTFKIVKAKNKIIKMLSAKTVSYKKLSKKDQTVKVTYKLLEKAPTTFKLKSVPKKVKKYVKVDPKGKIILKKGMPKGTYAIKLKVSIKASKNCKAASYVRTVKITVK